MPPARPEAICDVPWPLDGVTRAALPRLPVFPVDCGRHCWIFGPRTARGTLDAVRATDRADNMMERCGRWDGQSRSRFALGEKLVLRRSGWVPFKGTVCCLRHSPAQEQMTSLISEHPSCWRGHGDDDVNGVSGRWSHRFRF